MDRLFERVGLCACNYRSKAVTRRLAACLRRLRVATVAEGLARLEREPGVAWALLDVVLLGVTEFRRDAGVFERIERLVLPSVCSAHSQPRIWSAACSDGQELYSVAAALASLGTLDRCELLGTDCRPSAIARARLGIYPQDSAGRLDCEWTGAHFLATAAGIRARPRLLNAASWRLANLLAHAESGPWHLVLWRNMAIYLEPPVAARTWGRIVAEVAPGGYIVVGKAELPPPELALERIDACIYRKY